MTGFPPIFFCIEKGWKEPLLLRYHLNSGHAWCSDPLHQLVYFTPSCSERWLIWLMCPFLHKTALALAQGCYVPPNSQGHSGANDTTIKRPFPCFKEGFILPYNLCSSNIRKKLDSSRDKFLFIPPESCFRFAPSPENTPRWITWIRIPLVGSASRKLDSRYLFSPSRLIWT